MNSAQECRVHIPGSMRRAIGGSESRAALTQCRLAICARGDVARGAKCPVRCGLVSGLDPGSWLFR